MGKVKKTKPFSLNSFISYTGLICFIFVFAFCQYFLEKYHLIKSSTILTSNGKLGWSWKKSYRGWELAKEGGDVRVPGQVEIEDL